MTRERLLWLLAVLGLAGGAWWLSANTEWVEVDSPRPARGEARDNPAYAFEQLLRRLGMAVEHHEALATMPPPGARLVLLSHHWELLPGHAERLQQWVKRGGHLVLAQPDDWDGTALKHWVPVTEVHVERERRKPAVPAPASAASAGRAAAAGGHTELHSTPPLWDGTPSIKSCYGFRREWMLRIKPGQAVAWTLAAVDGTRATQDLLARQTMALQAASGVAPARDEPAVQALRLPVGQGSVTVVNANERFFHNAAALDCEHPLLLAALVQAEPGAVAWVYVSEKREPLLPWLWQQGWIAIVAGLLALAAALWRAAVRFGPRLSPAPRLRRSISEQVRGLAAYLQGSGREALLAAQQRALNEQAARSLPRYARLALPERARAIATATGLVQGELVAALSARFCSRTALTQHLHVLETARRRLHRTEERRIP